MNKIPAVVVPTNRPSKIAEFIASWKDALVGCNLIIVYDDVDVPDSVYIDCNRNNINARIFNWKNIDDDFGDDAWIIPRRTDCIRSYGFYKAIQLDPLFICTLDDDILPAQNHMCKFYKRLYEDVKYQPHGRFYNTLSGDILPRGTPKGYRRVGLVHGGWKNVPDLSARDQAINPQLANVKFNDGYIPHGCYYSMCGMNIAFRPQITNLMYFGLQGHEKTDRGLKKLPIDRCGDIFAGIYSKKIMDVCGYSVYNGEPYCIHTRASNVWTNMSKEFNSHYAIESFIEYLENKYGDEDGKEYLEMAVSKDYLQYFKKLDLAYDIWNKKIESV